MMATGTFLVSLMLFFAPLESCLEQRACIKACVNWGFDPLRTVNSIRAAFADHALSSLQIRFWFKRFQQNPDRGTKDEKHTGRPKSQRTQPKADLIQNAIQEDSRRTENWEGSLECPRILHTECCAKTSN